MARRMRIRLMGPCAIRPTSSGCQAARAEARRRLWRPTWRLLRWHRHRWLHSPAGKFLRRGGRVTHWSRVSRYGLIALLIARPRRAVRCTCARCRDSAQRDCGYDLRRNQFHRALPDFAVESDKTVEGLRIGIPAEYFAEASTRKCGAHRSRHRRAQGGRLHDQAGFSAAHEYAIPATISSPRRSKC